MNRFQNFKNGLLKDNPVFSLYLGICSTLAITTSVNNGLGMGVAVICVLIMSNVIISLVRNITPEEIRIPVYSALDGLGMGLGYTLAVTSMSLIREVLSTGMINLVNPFDETQVLFNIRILPDDYVISMFSSPVGAFVTFAILAALVSVYKNHADQKVAAKEVK